MKKLLVLLVVLGISSAATAATSIVLQVNPGDALPSYETSTTITVEIVAAGFGTSTPAILTVLGTAEFDAVLTNNDGTSSAPEFNPQIFGATGSDVGVVTNAGGILIDRPSPTTQIRGAKETGDTGISDDWVYRFEYHIPDLEESATITISIDNASFKNGLGQPVIPDTWTSTVDIHVVPEPMTIALLGLGGLFLRRRK